MQLLFYVMPLSAVAQFITLPFTEDLNAPKAFDFNLSFLVCLMLSGGLAFCVNLSGFLVIGKATRVTYNVVTHCKTVVVILGGFLLFASPLVLKNVFGIVVTLLGAWSYAYFKLMGASDSQSVASDTKKADQIPLRDVEAPPPKPPPLPSYHQNESQ